MKKPDIVKQIVRTVLPAFVILFAIVYVIWLRTDNDRKSGVLMPGKALASFNAFYPVHANPDGSLYLDTAQFMRAVDYFSNLPASRAAGELIYIGQSNNITLQLGDDEQNRYLKLLQNPAYAKYRVNPQTDPLKSYKNIIDGIGMTLAGTGVEIVLHDTRNPLKSIIALQNPISGRKVGDSTTNFGYELIKSYAAIEEEGPNYVSYALTTKDGRKIKSTTIPLYQQKNLVGFICVNIDISRLGDNDREAESTFIKAFIHTSDSKKINEVLDNSSRNSLTTETLE